MRSPKFLYHILLLLFLIVNGKEFIFSQEIIKGDSISLDSAKLQYFISKIVIEGNKKTHERVILRELVFKEGEIIDAPALKKAIDQSTINLLKQPLFNYVTIETMPEDTNNIQIKILVEERWYLWPELSIVNNENFNTWIKDPDFSKLDIRLAIKKYNAFGLNHVIKTSFTYGYTRAISFGYEDLAIDKAQKHLVGFTISHAQYNSVFYRNFKNKQESFKNLNNRVLVEKYLQFEYYFRPGINFHHRFYLSFKEVAVSDSLVIANPVFLAGVGNKNAYTELRYNFTFDKRDSRSYPLRGQWINFSIVKTGVNFKTKGDVNLLNISSKIKQFYNIYGRFYGAHSLKVKYSFNRSQPYYYQEGFGNYDFIRGFEYYLINGEDQYFLKNSLNFELLPQKISTLKFVPFKKFNKIHYAFYVNAFFDMGYSKENSKENALNNSLTNQLQYSAGLGIDLVTYYDNVFRIEYSINSLKESGIFFHFSAPL